MRHRAGGAGGSSGAKAEVGMRAVTTVTAGRHKTFKYYPKIPHSTYSRETIYIFGLEFEYLIIIWL